MRDWVKLSIHLSMMLVGLKSSLQQNTTPSYTKYNRGLDMTRKCM